MYFLLLLYYYCTNIITEVLFSCIVFLKFVGLLNFISKVLNVYMQLYYEIIVNGKFKPFEVLFVLIEQKEAMHISLSISVAKVIDGS